MEMFGLLGEKLGHSFSKEIHEIFFELTNKESKYELIEKSNDEIEDFISELKNGKYKGINVTVPYKVEIMKYLDSVSEIVKKIGAVNTISYKNEKLIGDNTDYFGFSKMLELNEIDVKNKKILILGTGGSARTVYNYLVDNEAEKIFLASMRGNKNFPKRKTDRIINYTEIKNLRYVDLIINCTPVGMYPAFDLCPLTDNNLIDCQCLIDIIYNPKETILIKKYKEKGIKTVNGLLMLIYQAIKAEEIWNEESYNIELIEKICEKLEEKLCF